MRKLIYNDKLLKILNLIENRLGYEIETGTAPEQDRPISMCGIRKKEEKNVFLYYPDEIPTQATLCHELMHIVHEMEGYPTNYHYPNNLNNNGFLIIRQTANLIRHTDIWELVEKLGFDESEFYNIDSVIKHINEINLCDWAKDPFTLIWKAFDLAQAFLRKNTKEKKNSLENIAELKIQQSYDLAKTITQIIQKYMPITPQIYPNAFDDIIALFGFPNGSIKNIPSSKSDLTIRNEIMNL